LRKVWVLPLVGAVSLALIAAACGSSGTTPTSSASSSAAKGSVALPTGNLTITLQPDLGYSPLYIVEQEGWLKTALPDVHVTWETLNSGSAIETGMITGHIDVGAGGVAPFLLGVNKGVGWKLLSSLDEENLWLVCHSQIKSFKDITSSDRISVVAPTSIQAIVIKKMAQTYLGNPSALDGNLVILSHPVSEQAFAAGRTACALDAPPFEQQEVAAGGHVLSTSYQMFGTSTFNSTFVLPKFYDSHEQEMQILVAQIKRAVSLLNEHPNKAATIISAYEKGQLSVPEALKDLTAKGTHWTITPHGYIKYATFMHSVGLISSVPSSIKAIELPTLYNTSSS
jgi:NitT/TauT family transport system substrate-binding protein